MAAIKSDPHPVFLPLHTLFQDIPLFLPLRPEIIELKALIEEGSIDTFSSVVLKCHQLVQQFLEEEAVKERDRCIKLREHTIQLYLNEGKEITAGVKARLPKVPSASALSSFQVKPLHTISTDLEELLDRQIGEYLPFWNDIAAEVKEPHKKTLLGIFKGIKMADTASSEADLDKCSFPGFWIVYYSYLGGYEDTVSFVLELLSFQEKQNLLLDVIEKKPSEKFCSKLDFLQEVEEKDQDHAIQTKILPLAQMLIANPKKIEREEIPQAICDEAFEKACGRGLAAPLKFLTEKKLVSPEGYNAGFMNAVRHGENHIVQLFEVLEPRIYNEGFSLAATSCYIGQSFSESTSSPQNEREVEKRYAAILLHLLQTKEISLSTLFEALYKLASHKKMKALKVFFSKETPDAVFKKAAELFIDWKELLSTHETKELGPAVIFNAGIGNVEELQKLFKQEEGSQEKLLCTEIGEALIAAAEGGYVQAAALLLDHTAPLDPKQNTENLERAITERNLKNFATYYAKQRKVLLVDESEAFIAAARGGHLGVLILLSTETVFPYRTYERAICKALKTAQQDIYLHLLKTAETKKPSLEDEVLRSMELFKTPDKNPETFAKEEESELETGLLKAVEAKQTRTTEFLLKSPNLTSKAFNRAFLTVCKQGNVQLANLFLNPSKTGGKTVPKETLLRGIAAAKEYPSLLEILQKLQKQDFTTRVSSLSFKEE